MIESIATPATTPRGLPELRRVWEPEGEPWAEVLIVHGLGEHSGRYERTGQIMAEAGLRVRSFDLIGFGATGGPRGHVDSWEEFLDQVQAHVDASGRPLALLGHSMGGQIALEYALTSRTKPDVLVLSAPALGGGAAWQRKAAPVIAALAGKLSVPNALKGEQLSRDPAVGEAYFSDPLVLTKSTAKMGAELFAAMDRAQTLLHQLDLPTLVMHGGSDTIVPPQATVVLESVAERRLLVGLRHEIFNEPEGPEVVGEVVEWIRTKLAG